MVFLGVDGGGTKTVAVVVDENGKVLYKGIGGSSNIAESPRRIVEESFKRALAGAMEFLKEDVISVFGLTSVGEIRGVEDEYSSIVKKIIGLKPDVIVNDVVIAWAAGTLGKDGVHLIAGTGSIAYGRKGNREVRVGGWGSWVSDEGSAYHIGMNALREISKQMDGRHPQTQLKYIVFSAFGFKDHYDFLEWIYSESYDRRKRIASVAMHVYRAAKMGDEIARSILEEAGRELAEMVETAIRRLELEKPVVSYSGGVIEKNEYVFDEFEKSLRKVFDKVEIVRIKMRPVYGAVLLAAKEAGIDMEEMYRRLEKRE